jgi:hypothetical protein
VIGIIENRTPTRLASPLSESRLKRNILKGGDVMPNKNKVVMGIYTNRAELERSVDELRLAGFRSADISALLPSSDSTKEFAHTMATKLPEGAATGGTTGAVIGGAIGWLAAVGTIAVPGLGPFLAAGPITAMFATGAAGAAIGSLTGALVGLGVPEYEANRYEGFVKNGGHLLSVHCDDNEWVKRAKDIFERTGGTQISATSEAQADSDDSVNKDIPRPAGNY